MNILENLSKIKKIHFIGVCGISMSALARYFRALKIDVSGSDKNLSENDVGLANCGITLYKGHNKNNVVGADAVVYTSAIDQDNVELVAAKELGIKTYKRSEVLGYIISKYKKSIAVSGSHGKTTVTAMLSEIFTRANKNPTCFIGGNYKKYGNFILGNGDYAIVEACEYMGNFLDVRPTVSVVLGVDNDHLESFGGIENEIAAFKKFTETGLSVINADDVNSASLIGLCSVTFGINNKATFMAKRIKKTKRGYSFCFYAYGKNQGRLSVNVSGKHNVYNALASASVGYIFQIPFTSVKTGLSKFTNVSRRNEELGKVNNAIVVGDYAHHPTEITAELNSIKERCKNYAVVFQPHTYSRTRLLTNEFINAFKNEKNVIIFKTYPAREKYDALGDGKILYQNIKRINTNCKYFDTEKELREYLKKLSYKVEAIVFIGAGDIYFIAKNFVSNFS